MKRYFISSMAVIFAALLTTGCFPTESQHYEPEQIDYLNQTDLDTNSLPELKNIKLDLTLPAETAETCSVSAKMKHFDKEKAIHAFFENGADLSETAYESDYDENEMRYVIEGEDGRLVVDVGRISFKNPVSLSNSTYDFFSSYYTVANYYADLDELFGNHDELSGFPFSKADEIVHNQMKKIDVTNLGEPEWFSINAAELNPLIEADNQKNEKYQELLVDSWEEDDECYAIYYPLVYGNVCTSVQHDRSGSVKATVRRDGLVSVSVDFAYDLIPDSDRFESAGIRAEDALNRIINQYQNYSMTNPAHITECRLCIVPAVYHQDGTYELRTAWQFYIWKDRDIDWEKAGLNPHEGEFRFIDAMNGASLNDMKVEHT